MSKLLVQNLKSLGVARSVVAASTTLQQPSSQQQQQHQQQQQQQQQQQRHIHLTAACSEIRKLARLRVVDNSDIGKRAMAEGRPPRCIHVYNKRGVGQIGDKVLVAIKGQMKKGILVGLKQNQKPKVPKFDSNNIVLIDDNGTPLGTRIHVPMPTILRTVLKEKTLAKGADYTKVLAIASRYI